MTDGQKVLEEFPEKQKEDRICPSASQCKDPKRDGVSCRHSRAHTAMNGCDETCFYASGECITISPQEDVDVFSCDCESCAREQRRIVNER